MTKMDARVLRDWQFYACLAFGPLAWAMMSYLLPVREDWTGILRNGLQFLLLAGVYPILEEVATLM